MTEGAGIDLEALATDLRAAGLGASHRDGVLEWITEREHFSAGNVYANGEDDDEVLVFINRQWVGPDTWTAFDIIRRHLAPAVGVEPGGDA